MADTSASEPIIYDFDPRNLPPEILRAVGLVTTAAAQTESTLQDLIGALLGIDLAQTMAVTAQLSGAMKDQIARALIELCAPDTATVDELDELLDRVNAAMEKRNALAHSVLARNPETGEVFTYKESSRGAVKLRFTPVLAPKIEADAAEIYEVGMEVMRFITSRGLGPRAPDRPTREPLKRGKAARESRRNL